MFAALNAYVNKSAFDNNPLIFFDTFNHKTGEVGYHVYKIFAVFKTTANLGEGFTYQKFENAANQEEFDKFVSTCKSMSFYDTGVTPQYGDKMICLSTCEYPGQWPPGCCGSAHQLNFSVAPRNSSAAVNGFFHRLCGSESGRYTEYSSAFGTFLR